MEDVLKTITGIATLADYVNAPDASYYVVREDGNLWHVTGVQVSVEGVALSMERKGETLLNRQIKKGGITMVRVDD